VWTGLGRVTLGWPEATSRGTEVWTPLREALSKAQNQPSSLESTADVVFRVIREAIVGNTLTTGVRLSEQGIADALNVSRTPVREALLRLVSAKLIDRDDRGRLRVHSLTRKRVLDLYDIRRVLEGLAARLAAKHCDDAAAFELAQRNRAFQQVAKTGEPDEAAEVNIEFHEAIAQAGRNDELLHLMRQIHEWVRMMPTTTLSYEGRLGDAHAEHVEITQAIIARDPDRAERLAQEHLNRSLSIRLSMLFPERPEELMPEYLR